MKDFNIFAAIMSPDEWADLVDSQYKALRKAIMDSDEAPGHALDQWSQIVSNCNSITEWNSQYDSLVTELQRMHIPRALELEDYEYMSKLHLAELYAIWKNSQITDQMPNNLNDFLNDMDLGPETDFDYDDEY